MYTYSCRAWRDDPHKLPDLEVWEVKEGDPITRPLYFTPWDSYLPNVEPGIYFWLCFPGCLPDGEKHGPFPSVFRAVREARRIYE